MRNFLKGFFLGFGLLLFLLVGVVLTRAYDVFFVPKERTTVRIDASNLTPQIASKLAKKYSAALGKSCEIELLSLHEQLLDIAEMAGSGDASVATSKAAATKSGEAVGGSEAAGEAAAAKSDTGVFAQSASDQNTQVAGNRDAQISQLPISANAALKARLDGKILLSCK